MESINLNDKNDQDKGPQSNGPSMSMSYSDGGGSNGSGGVVAGGGGNRLLPTQEQLDAMQPVLVHPPGFRVRPVFQPRKKNVIQQRCGPCITVCQWLPVVFVVSVLGWGYYAFIVQLCIFALNSVVESILLGVAFHFFMLMTLWSYYRTVMTPTGQVPRDFHFTAEEMDRLNQEPTDERRKFIFEDIIRARNLPVSARNWNGSFRVCEKCNLIKPDRAHHCSVCDTCILKMDHHCPWVNNCVSFSNYKFFILFLGYAFSLCLFAGCATFPFFLQFWRNTDHGSSSSVSPAATTTAFRIHILFLCLVSVMFAVSLASLFFYHIFLTLHNRSTIESFRTPTFGYGPDKKAYDLGSKDNWNQIFGPTALLWFIPVHTSSGPGFAFTTRMDKLTGDDSYEEGSCPLLRDVDSNDSKDSVAINMDASSSGYHLLHRD